jgi:hypothetical protein
VKIPVQINVSGVNQSVLSAARGILLYLSVTNTSGSPRAYLLADTSSPPAAGVYYPGNPAPSTQVWSPVIPAGQTWTAFAADDRFGAEFLSGCVLQSFAVNSQSNPVVTALSSADANVTAWFAPQQ